MGFFKLIFGVGKRSSLVKSLDLMDVDKAQEIVQCYESIRRKAYKHTTSPVVVDESKLPHPKPEIKKAIITTIITTNDSQLQKQLKSIYLGLSEWQQGVGEVAFHYSLNIPDSDFKNLTLTELAEKIDDQENKPNEWKDIVRKDRIKLEDDLVKLGLLRWRKRVLRSRYGDDASGDER